MTSIWTMGEILVEIMRPDAGIELFEAATFLGPFPSGAPAIFIDTVARLGHGAGIIGGVGADDFGRCVLDRLQQDGVNCDLVAQIPHRSTAVAFVTYFEDGSRKFIFHIDGTPAVMATAAGIEAVAGSVAFFHVMGCSLMANDSFREQIFLAMESFRARGAKVSFDPNIRPELLGDRSLEEVVGPVMDHCAVLLPGTAELALLSGQPTVEGAISHLFGTTGLEVIVVKRGKQGCSVFARNGLAVDVPAFPVREVDPTGAGDCFDAGFLCGLIEGLAPEECARMAAAAGALNAGAFGPMEGEISRARLAQVIEAGEVA